MRCWPSCSRVVVTQGKIFVGRIPINQGLHETKVSKQARLKVAEKLNFSTSRNQGKTWSSRRRRRRWGFHPHSPQWVKCLRKYIATLSEVRPRKCRGPRWEVQSCRHQVLHSNLRPLMSRQSSNSRPTQAFDSMMRWCDSTTWTSSTPVLAMTCSLPTNSSLTSSWTKQLRRPSRLSATRSDWILILETKNVRLMRTLSWWWNVIAKCVNRLSVLISS